VKLLSWNIYHSFIHSGYLHSAPSRNLLSTQSSYGQREMSREACRRHVVPRQQAISDFFSSQKSEL